MTNQVTGVVESAVYTGELVSSTVRVGPHLIALNRFARGASIAPGDTVTLGWQPEDAVLIPEPAA
ncbi:TOBE domain-containing protein [Humitalea sp. 24SJ18S-53]|uniref:TOBE domain-containing protein n=1 Tax=Humitalea sp. 24SJ18S-53 TaxID=3422307 RepID=UPI003D670B2F